MFFLYTFNFIILVVEDETTDLFIYQTVLPLSAQYTKLKDKRAENTSLPGHPVEIAALLDSLDKN